MLSLVRSRLPSLLLIEGDIYSEALVEGGFEVLTLWHVLEHLPNPAAVLQRVRALLRPGGWLFVSLPRFDSLQASIFRSHWYAFDDVPRHLYHFSKSSLDRLLREAGFAIQRHLLFSRLVNFHTLKHSLLNWSEDRFSSRVPYYSLKPFLFPFVLLEEALDRYGILTVIAQNPS
jgi:SAM-dependent methyltransferase